jgi:hypothetical protein
MLTYIEHIKQDGQLPEVDFDAPSLPHEIMRAQRHKAWLNPDWHDRMTIYEKETKHAGYDARHFWIWDKWGWV